MGITICWCRSSSSAGCFVASDLACDNRYMSESHVILGGDDYAEVYEALVSVRRFACEMSDAFGDIGRAEPEDAGARAMIDACDRALETLRYDEDRA